MRTAPSRTLAAALLLAAGAGSAACGGPESAPAPPAMTAAAPAMTASPPAMMQASPLAGPLTVLAATPLTAAYQDVQAKLAGSSPNLTLTYDFADPAALNRKLTGQPGQGGAADVITSSDQAGLQALAAAGTIEPAEVLATQGGTVYRIAVVTGGRNQAAARAFVNYVISGPGQGVLRARGFTAP